MSLEGKKDTDRWFPVILTDESDFMSAITGKAYGDVTCKFSFEAASSQSTHTVTTDEWREAGEGTYWLKIGASEFTSEGKYEVSVTVSGALVFNFAVEVRDENLADLLDTVDVLAIAVGNIPTTMVGTDGAALATEVDKVKTALVNKMIVTEASGAVEQFDSSDTTLGSIASAFASDGTYTTRKRLEI